MQVSAVTASGGNVIVGGTFTNAGGLNRTNLALLNGTTGAALPWTPNPNFGVSALLVSGNTLYVGGGFRRIAGQNRTNLAAIDIASGNALVWPNDSPNATVTSMAL